jgi:hypothetical protein
VVIRAQLAVAAPQLAILMEQQGDEGHAET